MEIHKGMVRHFLDSSGIIPFEVIQISCWSSSSIVTHFILFDPRLDQLNWTLRYGKTKSKNGTGKQPGVIM